MLKMRCFSPLPLWERMPVEPAPNLIWGQERGARAQRRVLLASHHSMPSSNSLLTAPVHPLPAFGHPLPSRERGTSWSFRVGIHLEFTQNSRHFSVASIGGPQLPQPSVVARAILVDGFFEKPATIVIVSLFAAKMLASIVAVGEDAHFARPLAPVRSRDRTLGRFAQRYFLQGRARIVRGATRARGHDEQRG